MHRSGSQISNFTCYTVDLRRCPLNVTVERIRILYGHAIELLPIALLSLGLQPVHATLQRTLDAQPAQELNHIIDEN